MQMMTKAEIDTETLASRLKDFLANEKPELNDLVNKFDISTYYDHDGDERYAVIVVLKDVPPKGNDPSFDNYFDSKIRPLNQIISDFFRNQEVAYIYRTFYATEKK